MKRIVVIGVPDPVPLSECVLETLSQSIQVEICVFAPEALAKHFDVWGRPLPEKWLDFQIGIPDKNIFLVGSPHPTSRKSH